MRTKKEQEQEQDPDYILELVKKHPELKNLARFISGLHTEEMSEKLKEVISTKEAREIIEPIFKDLSLKEVVEYSKKIMKPHDPIKFKSLKEKEKEAYLSLKIFFSVVLTEEIFKKAAEVNKEKAELIKREVELKIKEAELKKKESTIIERLHRQPRSLLKTVAQRIGNTTDEPTLFTLPQKLDTRGGAIANLKEEISKNTAALALFLIQLYQDNGNKDLEITNLSPLSEMINCNNHRLKLYLLYLGGFVYPIVDIDEKTNELVLTNEQLFKIEFRYNPNIKDKYTLSPNGEVLGVERIGTDILTFIKNEPLDRVIIKPSERFLKALDGKGLGYILTVNDQYVGLILELTDIATKILSYSSSNKPSQKIAEDKLIKHLGLIKQTKRQGKPRVRATILKGLQELQDKGHIKSYSYDEATGMYSYTYSDKYVKYKQSKRDKKEPPQGVQ